MNDLHLAMICSGISEASICSSRRSIAKSATNLQISHWPVKEKERAKNKLSILAKPSSVRSFDKSTQKLRGICHSQSSQMSHSVNSDIEGKLCKYLGYYIVNSKPSKMHTIWQNDIRHVSFVSLLHHSTKVSVFISL